jgi:hypothetical protein
MALDYYLPQDFMSNPSYDHEAILANIGAAFGSGEWADTLAFLINYFSLDIEDAIPLTAGGATDIYIMSINGDYYKITVNRASVAASDGLYVDGSGPYNTVAAAQSAIFSALGGAGSAVNVTGGLSGVSSSLIFSIPSGKTLRWGAQYSGPLGSGSMINLSSGDGTFELIAGGSVINNGTGNAVFTNGANATVIISGGEVSAGTLYGISVTGANATVNVSGGTVRADTGNAIRANGANSTVHVSGGEVSNSGTVTEGAVIYTTGTNVTVSGTGKVNTTTALGVAIHTTGNVSVTGGEVSATTGRAICALGASSTVSVSGGTVTATTGWAVFASGANATVTVNGGFVFAYGAKILETASTTATNAMIFNSNATNITGTGVVAAWNQVAAGASPGYTAGTSTDLAKEPSSASVVWASEGDRGGIRYTNGANTGFLALPVTVVPATQEGYMFTDIDGNVLEHLTAQTLVTTLQWRNKTQTPENLTMYVAVYTSSGKMVYLGADTIEIGVGATEQMRVSLALTANADGIFVTEGYYVNVFIWDSVTFVPVAEKYTFK